VDAINYPLKSELRIEEGNFVYAVLHNDSRDKIGLYQNNSHDNIAAISRLIKRDKDVWEKDLPTWDRITNRSLEINGTHYLEIHAKLMKAGDGSDIYIRTFFALSDQALESVREFAIKTVSYVAAIVLITTAILYPVIVFLFGRLVMYSNNLLAAHLQTVEALGETIAKRDSDTNYHNYRVTIYTVLFAEFIGVSRAEMPGLIKGAFLHDIGKIGIRDNILLTRESFGEKEHDIMKKHVKFGLEIIQKSIWLKDAAHIVGFHHEKYDGSGYPSGISGTAIPLAARIFTIVDVFDALTSKRPYKASYSYERTMELLEEGRSSHFDPELLDQFEKIAKEMYARYAGRENDSLKSQFKSITDLYFHSDLSAVKR